MIHHETEVPAEPAELVAARKLPKSKGTAGFLKALETSHKLAATAAEIYTTVAPMLTELQAGIVALRSQSVAALLTEARDGVREDVSTVDAVLVGAENTARDLHARFLDLARTLRTVTQHAEPVTSRALAAGYGKK